MPPANKKKKKPAANPSRGFATQSVASKNKESKDDGSSETPASITTAEKSNDITTSDSPITTIESSASRPKQQTRDLHELSPEELESRLEEAELEGLIESTGLKAHRDSARQSSKLQTDCRVLRSQAQSLSTKLLPPDMLSEMFSLVKEHQAHENTTGSTVVRKQKVSENEMLHRLWTLQEVLSSLGFREEHVDKALHHAVINYPMRDGGNYVWGFKDSLEWLALTLNDDDLPIFDPATGKLIEKSKDEIDIDPTTDEKQDEKSRDQAPTNGQVQRNDSRDKKAERINAEGEVEEPVSDLNDDLEPQEMVSVYLKTKTRLYGLRPDLFDTAPKRNKANSKPFDQTPARQSTVARLQNKLKKLSFDLLFDQDEAERQWQEQRIRLAQEEATRRKLQLSNSKENQNDSANASNATDTNHAIASTIGDTSANNHERDDDDDTAIADLFAAEASDTTAGAHGTNGTTDLDVLIRDFGNAKGVDPRRVLEDACHSRDSAVKLSYKVISSTAFSIRHSLQIAWSKKQNIIPPLKLPSMSITFQPSRFSFSMNSIATPNRQQSQAYVSVIALFLIFSTFSKEDKAYLRLPPVWRDLYTELTQQQAEQSQEIEKTNVRKLRDIIREATATFESESDEDVVLTKNIRRRNEQHRSGSASPAIPASDHTEEPGEHLKNIWDSKANTASFQRMYIHRKELPVFAFRNEALLAIEKNQVTIICGETGCGKSTQIPSYILEHELSQGRPCRIYCTEPRRISAITLAQRVSEELGESKRDLGTSRSLVGYAIRLESKFTSFTRLVYATTGILLRMLESPEGTTDITHLVIDEVHERSIETDFLLIILKNLRLKRPSLRIILMSATVDASRFSTYFCGAPVLDVPGRTFPVEDHFLEDTIESTGYTVGEDERYVEEVDADIEEQQIVAKTENARNGYSPKTLSTLGKINEYRIQYDLILKLIEHIIMDRAPFARALLVFLPGIAEIRRMNGLLSGNPITSNYIVHALHSTISSEEQQQAFQPPPRGYSGKIVLSTNIAETGVTIPDITCVIDTGKHKEMRFDERRQISRLVEAFVSRANAKQRRGRAGRVQEGLCFHLFSRTRHDRAMPDQQTPEILRLSLQDLIMRVKICKLGDIQTTLSSALDAPSTKNIQRAIDALVEVGALTSDEELTPLGVELAKLPLDPYLGKLALYGAHFSCLDTALTIAAILSSKSPFVTSADSSKATDMARQAFAKADSDLLTDYNAYCAWRRICTAPPANAHMSESQFCKRNMLSQPTLSNIEDLKSQLYTSLSDAGCLPSPPSHKTANDPLQPLYNSTNPRSKRFLTLPAHLTTHNSCTDLLTAIIAASFHPKLLARSSPDSSTSTSKSNNTTGWRNIATNQSVSLHPSSIFKTAASATANTVRFLSFYSILQTSSGIKHYNANSLTPVPPLLMLLLAGAGSSSSSASSSSSELLLPPKSLNSDTPNPSTSPTFSSSTDTDALTQHPTARVLTLDISGQKLRFIVSPPPLSTTSTPLGEWKLSIILSRFRAALAEIQRRRWAGRGLSLRLERWWAVWERCVAAWEERGEVGGVGGA